MPTLSRGRPKGSKNNPHRARLDVKQSTIQRTIRACQAMNLPVSGVEVDPRTGRIVVHAGPLSGPRAIASEPNPWDTDHAQDAKRSA
jgi:hypothetical protein